MSDDQFINYLRETLIPDLLDSGRDETAEDVSRCVRMIDKLRRQLTKATKKRRVSFAVIVEGGVVQAAYASDPDVDVVVVDHDEGVSESKMNEIMRIHPIQCF